MTRATVALVGRPNVGKSTLFNRIAEERIAIVEDVPGVTRDRLYAKGEWLNVDFSIIDTGGITLEEEDLDRAIFAQAEVAIEEADVIIYVGDAETGITDLDERIASILHRSKKPIVLAINKVDNEKRRSEIYEFYSLGLGNPYPVSGSHGLGLGDVLDQVVASFPADNMEVEDDSIHFSLIGRPNVGKSSLVNAILGEERAIVSDVAGTTRDATDAQFITDDERKFTIIDTAGIRKKGKIYENTEKYSVLRSMRAIERSDVVLVVLDAESGIVEQDKRVAGYAHEEGKGIIILVNKWDLVEKDNNSLKEFEDNIRYEFPYLAYAPILFVSAVTKQRLAKLPDLIETVYSHSQTRIQSSLINEVIQDAVAMNATPTDKGRRLRIYYATQVSVGPPAFVVFVNDPEMMHFSYERYLENQLRQAFDFVGTRLKIITRERS